MIERKDILSLNFLKKLPFTGSYKGMRYRISKMPGGKSDELLVVIWAEPYSYDATPQEQKEEKCFPFSEEGIAQAVDWLNGRWEEEEERWKEAKSKW